MEPRFYEPVTPQWQGGAEAGDFNSLEMKQGAEQGGMPQVAAPAQLGPVDPGMVPMGGGWRAANQQRSQAQQELAAAEEALAAMPAGRDKMAGGFDPMTLTPVAASPDRANAEMAVRTAKQKLEEANKAEMDSRDIEWATEIMRAIRQNPRENARMINSPEFIQAQRILNAAR
jgi:hypothetical protein